MKAKLRGNIVPEADMVDSLDGKSVAVVGNAQSLQQYEPGREIDDFDVVVRFNEAATVPGSRLGMKTSILVLATEVTVQRLAALSPESLLWVSGKRRKMGAILSAGIPTSILSDESRRRLLPDFPGRPSSGFMLLSLLRTSRVRSVSIFGFDFYQSGSTSGDQTLQTTPHDYDREHSEVRKLLGSDERFGLWH